MNNPERSRPFKIIPFSSLPLPVRSHPHGRRLAVMLLAGLVFLTLPLAAGGQGDATTGTIAYVDDVTKDEIRLIEPDGSGDRRLWAHGQPDPNNVYEIWNLAWRPDAAELAFASEHENWCSINQADIYTIGANLAGLPAVSVPCGRSAQGLPIGLQLLAGPLEEEKLLRAARVFERATDWHTRRPQGAA